VVQDWNILAYIGLLGSRRVDCRQATNVGSAACQPSLHAAQCCWWLVALRSWKQLPGWQGVCVCTLETAGRRLLCKPKPITAASSQECVQPWA
jgi:hypothetical protein